MGTKKEILVVEDEIQFAEMIKLRLELTGYSVSIATDTSEGISKIQNNFYDLLILDLMMPGGGGITLLEAIKNQPDKAAIPAIVVTGKTVTADLKKKLDEYHIADVFIKPYDPAQFLGKINELLA
jgi:two-component system alkaline phosphatase synthesis response regulator PhoP